MRIVIAITLLTLALLPPVVCAEEAWETRVTVPARVNYKQATAEENRPAVERVRRYFAPDYKGADQMAPVFLTAGPFLWRDLKSRPELEGKGIPVTMKIPAAGGEIEMEGRGFVKSPADVETVLGMVRQELREDGGFTIRKLDEQELDLLWSMFGFDLLEDPLLLLESPHHRYVLVFNEGELFQIDDFYEASLPEPMPPKAGPHPFVEETSERFWSTPHDQVDPSKLISGEGVQILSPDEEVHRSWSTEAFIDYCGELMEARKRAMAQAGKTGRNLSIQVELRPDGEFFTIVCVPPLPTALESSLRDELRRITHPPLRSIIAVQLFCRVWGGASP